MRRRTSAFQSVWGSNSAERIVAICRKRDNGNTATVRVPTTIHERGEGEVIVSPDDPVLPGALRQATTTAYPALLKALAAAPSG
jgi:hypothetical protein